MGLITLTVNLITAKLSMSTPNKHIDDFLEYYYELATPPEYAVLIKGAWGSGKSWFINQSLEKLGENGGKYIYVSLYGITSYEEIEDAFFRELHPLLSSKGMALTGRIAKGLLKATLKIDIDGDGKPDGAITGSIPDINIPEYLTNTDDFVLVFDDLERCSINIVDVLGYINHFVEHQGHKTVIIANEEEIINREESDAESSSSYRRIKEKIIGKTFEIKTDLDGALDSFISSISTEDVKELYTNRAEIISSLYISSGYNNLRHLKQSLWDFERLFWHLPDEAKSNNDLLIELLKLYLAYSFEIKSGTLLPDKLRCLKSNYYSSLFNTGKSDDKENPYKKISAKYKNVSFLDPIIEESLWEDIFDRGVHDKESIQDSLFNSKYFQSDNTPDWVTLWHAIELTDDDFEKYFSIAKDSYNSKQYEDLGIIKHITGIFLWLSDIGIYKKKKEEILDSAKLYINTLKDNGKLAQENFHRGHNRECESYGGLAFIGRELKEFNEFCQYIEIKTNESRIESLPTAGKELLEYMISDTDKFYRMLVTSNHEDNIYYEIPILKYIKEETFVAKFMSLSPKQKRTVGNAIKDRFEYDLYNKKLKDELEWLQDIKKRFTQKQKKLKGKMSGHLIGSIVDQAIDKAIERLL